MTLMQGTANGVEHDVLSIATKIYHDFKNFTWKN